MFIHNINPTLINLWGLEIRYYGLVYVIGFLLLYYFIKKKSSELGIEKKNAEDYVLWIILGSVIGARLFMIFWDPVYYLSNPLRLLYIWQGGMSLHGGIVGAIIAAYGFSRKYKISFFKLADITVIPALFALALGRIANFINSELIGTVTNVKWCVDFGDSLCRHPAQLYGAIGRFILFFGLFYYDKVKKYKDGFLFWCFVFFMGLGRFLIDFLREDSRVLGLSLGQYFSLVMVLVGGYVLWKKYRKDLKMI